MTDDTAFGKGKATISAAADFEPMSAGLAQTRTAGDAIKDIGSLHVLLYDYDSESLVKSWEITEYQLNDIDRSDADAENGQAAEASTKRASFDLADIDFGKYRICWKPMPKR